MTIKKIDISRYFGPRTSTFKFKNGEVPIVDVKTLFDFSNKKIISKGED